MLDNGQSREQPLAPSNTRLSEELIAKLESTAEYFSDRVRHVSLRLGERLASLDVNPAVPAELELSLWFPPGSQGDAIPIELKRLSGMVRTLDILTDLLAIQRASSASQPSEAAYRMSSLAQSLRCCAEDYDLATIGTRCEVNRLESLNLSLASLFEQHGRELGVPLPPPPASCDVVFPDTARPLSHALLRKITHTSEYLSSWIEHRCRQLGSRLIEFARSAEPNPESVRTLLYSRGDDFYPIPHQLEHLRGTIKALGLLTSISRLSRERTSDQHSLSARRMSYLVASLRDCAKDPEIGTIGRSCEINRFESVDNSLASIYEQHRQELDQAAPPTRRAR